VIRGLGGIGAVFVEERAEGLDVAHGPEGIIGGGREGGGGLTDPLVCFLQGEFGFETTVPAA
jgi:hypothetical protein